ncbi:molybdopterin adenylyltransferase [Methylacidiphilum caldifontis]|uniref:Molybdopterin adenylyltransferase n=1 Tax=Methylacidiphilum caldifontis TaxID=2795386 RepID=A0A4Y8PEN3_9BACT|nr:molybdopterin adenylyltransferase [Methylacidiphilum caldifontis]QSR88072.1 molybdopterin adenylyltransferase [Methylacidiphilum caldifontis]TFE69609.1 molybdopterin adenylyltransferase [Methylacidiphilum caldifontis]
MKIGRITLSDRASAGIYKDKSGPEIERVIKNLFAEPLEFVSVLIPDDKDQIVSELSRLVDELDCPLVLTTGGTGPSLRDVTPEATKLVLDKELPGFGEIMRMESYKKVRTAILSRATAGIRKRSLIINLPGNPSAISECLSLLGEAIAECLDHIRGYRPALASKPTKNGGPS